MLLRAATRAPRRTQQRTFVVAARKQPQQGAELTIAEAPALNEQDATKG